MSQGRDKDNFLPCEEKREGQSDDNRPSTSSIGRTILLGNFPQQLTMPIFVNRARSVDKSSQDNNVDNNEGQEGQKPAPLFIQKENRGIATKSASSLRKRSRVVQASKKEQEDFRNEIRIVIGEELIKQVVVIRPTRYGRYTITFQTDESRNKALKIFRDNESTAGIEEKASCIIAPKKKYAKAICREPPEDVARDKFLKDLYGVHCNKSYYVATRLMGKIET